MQKLIPFLFLIFFFSSCKTNKQSTVPSKGPITLTTDNFQERIIDNKNLSVVYFWATWCGPCKMTAPVIEDLAKKDTENITFGKVNVDKHRPIPMEYGIRSIPTVLIIKNGTVVDKYVGVFSKSTLKGMIKKHS